MNLDSVNMDSLGDIISSLSADDIQTLQGMAQSLFSGAGNNANEQKAQPQPTPKPQSSQSAGGFDFASMAKIASMMSLFSNERKDPRCDLLTALKPLLAAEKQPKVDQAVKMLQLLSILPKIKELNGMM